MDGQARPTEEPNLAEEDVSHPLTPGRLYTLVGLKCNERQVAFDAARCCLVYSRPGVSSGGASSSVKFASSVGPSLTLHHRHGQSVTVKAYASVTVKA